MINPTPGHIVWYRGADAIVRAAIVAHVNGVFNLNLHVFGINPTDPEQGYKEGVTHADPEQEPSCLSSWHWMPYQKQQAEKHANELAPIAEVGAALGAIARHASASDSAIEQEIQAKGLTAPRVTPADIEANIASTHYFTAQEGVFGAHPGFGPGPDVDRALGLLTFCVLVLQNGFTVTGESACASPENFDAEIGRKIARDNAINKVWPLMGYALKQELHRRAVFDASPKVGGQLIANGLNPHYKGQFEGETAEQADARRAAAVAAGNLA